MLVRLRTTLTAAAVFATLLVSQQALAHAHLALATPADNSVVSDSPQAIVLTFTEGVEAGFSGASVKGPEGKTVETGKATVDSANAKVLNIPVESTLTAGDYSVSWHVLSVDGHKTKGTYRFTVK